MAVLVQCFLQQSNSFILVKTRSAEVAQNPSSPRNHCWAQLCSRLLFRGHQLPLGVRIRAEIPLSSFSCSVLCHQPLLLPMVDIWHQDVPGTFPHCSAGMRHCPHPARGGWDPSGTLLGLWGWGEGAPKGSQQRKNGSSRGEASCEGGNMGMPVPRGRSGCRTPPGLDCALQQTQECPGLTDLH